MYVDCLLYVPMNVLSHFSSIWLFVTLWTLACQAPLSLGILQGRTLEWVAMPSSRVYCRSPVLQADSLPSEPPGKPRNTGAGSLSFLQGIFLTQELNRGFLHCRRILYQLSYQGSLNLLGTSLNSSGVEQLFIWISEVAQSCPTLCNPMDCSLPGSSIHRIFQAGVLEWVATAFSRDLPDPGIEPMSPVAPAAPALQADSLPLNHWGGPVQ